MAGWVLRGRSPARAARADGPSTKRGLRQRCFIPAPANVRCIPARWRRPAPSPPSWPVDHLRAGRALAGARTDRRTDRVDGDEHRPGPDRRRSPPHFRRHTLLPGVDLLVAMIGLFAVPQAITSLAICASRLAHRRANRRRERALTSVLQRNARYISTG